MSRGFYLFLPDLRLVGVGSGVAGDEVSTHGLLERCVQHGVYAAHARWGKPNTLGLRTEQIEVEAVYMELAEGFELNTAYGRGDVRADLLAVRRVSAMTLVRLHHVLQPPLQPLPERLTLGVKYEPSHCVAPRLCELLLDLLVFPAVDYLPLRPLWCVNCVAAHIPAILAPADPVAFSGHPLHLSSN